MNCKEVLLMYPLCGSGYLDIHLIVLSSMFPIPSLSFELTRYCNKDSYIN
jgi:hypothetical protein